MKNYRCHIQVVRAVSYWQELIERNPEAEHPVRFPKGTDAIMSNGLTLFPRAHDRPVHP